VIPKISPSAIPIGSAGGRGGAPAESLNPSRGAGAVVPTENNPSRPISPSIRDLTLDSVQATAKLTADRGLLASAPNIASQVVSTYANTVATPRFNPAPPWSGRLEGSTETASGTDQQAPDCPPDSPKTVEVGLFFEGKNPPPVSAGRVMMELFRRYKGIPFITGGPGGFAAFHSLWDAIDRAVGKVRQELCSLARLSSDGKSVLLCGNVVVDLFGFSQGGAMVLSTATRLSREGVTCTLRNSKGDRISLTVKPRIRFLGVIDPVGIAVLNRGTDEVAAGVENYFALYSDEPIGKSRPELASSNTRDWSPGGEELGPDGAWITPDGKSLDHNEMGRNAKVASAISQAFAAAGGHFAAEELRN
jgi:hypothetical protein